MRKATNGVDRKPFAQSRSLAAIIVILNVLLLTYAVLSYGRYTAIYQERLRIENLGNIANMNRSSAMNATALINSWDIKLRDITSYIEHHDMTMTEALTLIDEANSSGDREFQLIGSDYTGYLARMGDDGTFAPLDYRANAYKELQETFLDTEDSTYSDVCFAPEFTDGVTALKCFAIYRHLTLYDAHGDKSRYTLLLATVSDNVLAVLNSQNDFIGQSSVLIDSSGSYIVSNRDFKSTNFFQYLYVYNDLTLDQRMSIEQDVERLGNGELYYQDAMGRDCVFRFERMSTNDWYCVTCVPLASFRTPVDSANYAIYAVLALVLMLGTDIAWLQQMNRRLRISVLREKEASEAKTEFLSRMSHDIRTPLNGIIGLTTLALGMPINDKLREYLENINVSGQFLFGLVNDILDLSKVESGKVELNPEPYTSAELCKYVEAVVIPLCKSKGLTFHMSPSYDDTAVMLDRLRFHQILFNLLSNAVKYTPAGGSVELDWTRTKLPDQRVALDFIVRDNGIGMSEAFQKRMFDSFTQERSQTASTGTGLGLTIVKSLVSLMGGQISVESRQGVGSTFTVHLEVEQCVEKASIEPERANATLEGRRVLLCEDNDINIMVAQTILETWGMTVDVAMNGKMGVEMFEASEPDTYDAILMDVMMPIMNGLEAARAIRSLDKADAQSVPILAMTANAYDTDVQNCINAGMNAHTAKPIDTAQLHQLLSALIGGRGNLSARR